MKFVLVEDQVMFRGLVRRLLVEQVRGRVIFECTTLAELRANLDKVRQADLLLLDIRLPDGDGLDFVDELSRDHIGTAVLLFSSSCEDYIVHRASRSCAQGFVHKDEEPKVLLTAIQTVAAGGAYFSARFVEQRRRLDKNPGSFEKMLSPREQDLLRYVGAGYTDAEAAAALGAKTSTVATHRRNIMHKLGVHTAFDLQAYALKAGFTTIARLH